MCCLLYQSPQNRNAIPKDLLYHERTVRTGLWLCGCGDQIWKGPHLAECRLAPLKGKYLAQPPRSNPHTHAWQVIGSLYRQASGGGDFGSPPHMPAQYSRLCVADPKRAGSGNCKKVGREWYSGGENLSCIQAWRL